MELSRELLHGKRRDGVISGSSVLSTVRKYTFDDGWVGGHTDLNDKKSLTQVKHLLLFTFLSVDWRA